MFTLTPEVADAIRFVFQAKGAWAAAVELRHHYPGIKDNRAALEAVRLIVGWTPEEARGQR